MNVSDTEQRTLSIRSEVGLADEVTAFLSKQENFHSARCLAIVRSKNVCLPLRRQARPIKHQGAWWTPKLSTHFSRIAPRHRDLQPSSRPTLLISYIWGKHRSWQTRLRIVKEGTHTNIECLSEFFLQQTHVRSSMLQHRMSLIAWERGN